MRPLDEAGAIDDDRPAWPTTDVEAVAVCLLWSIANPAHELALGELLEQHLPGVPYTLSHALNPTLREYRRASCAAIDASLKPLMTSYLRGLEERLRAAGFVGAVADGHLERRRRRRRGHGRGSDPLGQLRARRWRRWRAVATRRSTGSARTP